MCDHDLKNEEKKGSKRILLPAGGRLVIDNPVLEQAEIGFHPCLNTSTLAVSMAEFREKILPALGHEATVVDLPVEESNN